MYTVRKSFLCFSLVILASGVAHAQAPVRDLDKLRQLVEAGAAPRAALDNALAELEDQADDLLLRQTLYSVMRPDETTSQQAAEMVAAAQRRLDRKQKRVDALKPLIEQGIMARTELTPHLEELDFRRRSLDLARSRADFLQQLSDMARAEQAIEQEPEDDNGWKPMVERFNGNGQFSRLLFKKVLLAWEKQFGKSLPVSADGETALHRSLGFDHRGRVDVAVNPDEPEGKWLVDLLKAENVPFYAIRGAVPGRSTGAHIHIGPPSTRLRVAD
jgi:hypothetical protein